MIKHLFIISIYLQHLIIHNSLFQQAMKRECQNMWAWAWITLPKKHTKNWKVKCIFIFANSWQPLSKKTQWSVTFAKIPVTLYWRTPNPVKNIRCCYYCKKICLWCSQMFRRALVWSFVNLGIGTSALELQLALELERILITLLFWVLQGLWTPNLAGWWLRMKRPHPQSQVTLRCRGHMTNEKRNIPIFTRPMYPKLSRVVTLNERTPPTKSCDSSISWSRGKMKSVISPFS